MLVQISVFLVCFIFVPAFLTLSTERWESAFPGSGSTCEWAVHWTEVVLGRWEWRHHPWHVQSRLLMSKVDLSLKLWLRVLSGWLQSWLIDLKLNKYEYFSYYFDDCYKSMLWGPSLLRFLTMHVLRTSLAEQISCVETDLAIMLFCNELLFLPYQDL